MRSRTDCCAVIPSAGTASRLGIEYPKACLPIAGRLAFDFIYDAVESLVDRVILVLSPKGTPQARNSLSLAQYPKLEFVAQEKPYGTGDAVFSSFPTWKDFAHIVVIWGDQVLIRKETLAKGLSTHLSGPHPAATIPLIEAPSPYVDYLFDSNKKLTEVQMSREGHPIRDRGLADVGTFFFSTVRLEEAWRKYQRHSTRGEQTQEWNLLPFLSYLSLTKGWSIRTTEASSTWECLGINTPEDLVKVQTYLEEDAAWKKSAF